MIDHAWNGSGNAAHSYAGDSGDSSSPRHVPEAGDWNSETLSYSPIPSISARIRSINRSMSSKWRRRASA